MVEIFRTDVTEPAQAEAMIARLRDYAPASSITFDLEDCDKVLRVESAILEVSAVISCMQAHGFECEILA
ncbi:hypothetical protein [Flavobacterium selenitireducens]|uniref:hypothetical protein n=1 Tax=Flavobacterium selenitireducens TaxID=2722704 RepID=UPI00168A48AF|nr:hypothetical protein [Flavobacterium selenitireducens]MBD3583166.1 hypothetical protein [Flavobacterium selenitireducens]